LQEGGHRVREPAVIIPFDAGIDDWELRDCRQPVAVQMEVLCDSDASGVAVALARLEPSGADAVVGAYSIRAVAAEREHRDCKDNEPD